MGYAERSDEQRERMRGKYDDAQFPHLFDRQLITTQPSPYGDVVDKLRKTCPNCAGYGDVTVCNDDDQLQVVLCGMCSGRGIC